LFFFNTNRFTMITIPPKQKEENTSPIERIAVGASEAARMLSISERTLWTLTKDKRIPATRVGRKWIYPVEGLRQFASGKIN